MNINRIKGIASGVEQTIPNRENIEAELLGKGFVSHSFMSSYNLEKRVWNWSCDILRKKG